MEHVILVNELDEQIGTEEKIAAHRRGLLHRAFSIFIFDRKGRLLLQRRAEHKYHCPGLWSNTCCSHPRPGEMTLAAAHRRLREEMGFDTDLRESFSFVYKVTFDNGLAEHEFDHVYTGVYNGEIMPNPEEVWEYQWVTLEELNDMLDDPAHEFTPWFLICEQRLRRKFIER